MPSVSTNDIDTYYERRGEGPPIVLVHGAVVDHAMWDEQVDALAGNYGAITYDVRGHGRTGGSDRARYTIDLFAEDLHALLDALDVERPVLCGLSLGGMIAQVYATRYPDNVAGLVLADTFAPPILTRGEWLLRRLVLPAVIGPARLLGYERVERANVWVAERLVGGSGGEYERVQRLRAGGPAMATDEFAKVIRAIARFHETRIDLSAIRAPTLVLYGENEMSFVRRHATGFGVSISDVAVEMVPDAGHASNLNQPQYFNAAVEGLLDCVAERGEAGWGQRAAGAGVE